MAASRQEHITAAIIAIAWVTTGRTGSVVQAKVQDFTVRDDTLQLTVRRGKSARLGQPPHTITTKMGSFAKYILPAFEPTVPTRDEGRFLFYAPTRQARHNMLEEVKITLRSATGLREMENRSLRRGALQCLAAAGAPTATLLSFSGHSQLATLKRYLDFGRLGVSDDLKRATPFITALCGPSPGAAASS
jgi:integrase